LSFIPSLLGASTLTLKVNEYRNKVLIGSSMRDIQVQTLNCNSTQPVITIDSSSLQGTHLAGGRIESCAKTPLNFCFKVKSPNSTAILVASDNHLGVAPGASMTYTGQTTDSIVGCFSWIPGPADTGLKIFTITVKDSTCLPPGIAVSQSFVLPIFIYPVTNIFKDTTICVGSSVPLKATGGNTFIWTVLPGGASLSSLSCTNCNNPLATPSTTTRYVVSSDLLSICNKNKDTVTVTVLYPPIQPPVTTNGPVCRGGTLRLFAGTSATSYAWTGPAGFTSTLQNPVIANVQLPNAGTYQLIAKNGSCASPMGAGTAVVNPAPALPTLSGSNSACEGQDLVIHASGAGTAATYYWTGPNGYTNATSGDLVIPNAGPQHAGAFTVRAGYPNNICLGGPATYTVTLNPKVTADFTLSKNPVCKDDTLSIAFSGSGASMDSLTWDFPNGQVLSGSNAKGYILRFSKKGEETINLIAKSSTCTDSIKKTITVLATPSAAFHVNREACINEMLEIEADGTVAHDLMYEWDFEDAQIADGAGRGRYHIAFTTPGSKRITFYTNDGTCQSATTLAVFVHPHPNAEIQSASKTDVCTSDTVRFSAYYQADYSFRWTPEQFFKDAGQPSTDAKVYKSGYVHLTVSDGYGCKGQDSLFIRTAPCCEISLPNAFTPNGDGRNDIFRIITIGNHAIKEFRVLNRWGQSVFGTFNEKEGWDGKIAGTPQATGTYYYYVRYTCSNGEDYEQKGEVTLVR
jgi:gliding motility-associated-like protein